MKKKDIKALFQAVRKGELAHVQTMLAAMPELVNATASAPPKGDDGQSPLQVALKRGFVDIANLLLDLGADVNHIEVSTVNEWRAPVLHDAIRATLMTLCYGGDLGPRSDAARAVLVRLLQGGADPNALDSFGNSALMRALLDTRQALDRRSDTAALREEKCREVFRLLLAAGADASLAGPDAESARQLARAWEFERFLS